MDQPNAPQPDTETLLLTALEDASKSFPARALRALDAAAELPTRVRKIPWQDRLTAPVATALSAWGGPFTAHDKYLITLDNGRKSFGVGTAAAALADGVLSGTSPASVLQRLKDAFANNRATGQGVMALRGITISQPIEFSNRISLVPIADLPDSRNKTNILQDEGTPAHVLFPATCALTVPLEIAPLFYPLDSSPPDQKEPLQLQNLLDDARLALTLVGPSVPVSAGYWFQFDDPVLAHIGSGSLFLRRGIRDPWRLFHPTALDAAEAVRTVDAFLALRDPLRSRIRLSLSRLFDALGEFPSGDRALDLAIALESLLVEGSNEITYRLALRAALITETDPALRVQLRALITALYGVRSSLIHNGEVAPVRVKGRGKVPAVEIVEEASQACAKILRAVLLRGELPDWETFEVSP